MILIEKISFLTCLFTITTALISITSLSGHTFAAESDWKKVNEVAETNSIFNVTVANYTSQNLGISLKIPTDWTVFEKPNRYEVGLDFVAYPISPTDDFFRLILAKDNILLDRDVKSMGFENYTRSELPRIALRENVTWIEDVNMTKYKIDGYETSTYLHTSKMQDGNTTVVRPFYVNQDGSCMVYNISRSA